MASPPAYTPVPTHEQLSDPEKGIDPHEQPTERHTSRKRNLWLFVTFVAFYFLFAGEEEEEQAKHALKHSMKTGQGYLQGFIEDQFKLDAPYELDFVFENPHPSIAASGLIEIQKKKHGKGKKKEPIPPKMAEGIFLQVPDEQSCLNASRRYTYQDHKAASGNQHLLALRLKQEYEELFGLAITGPFENVFEAGSPESQSLIRETQTSPQVWIDTYYPVMNEPVSRELSILSDDGRVVEWSGKLREDLIEEDPSSQFRDAVPVFHGLSASGNVSAPLVYAGYGRKADFDALADAGVDVKGTIVLVKYGAVFRGLKVKAAEEAGALATLIYSDPGDDGPMTEENGEKPYPEGKARQPSSVQRGSVQYLSSYPGDPTTPNAPAYRNATRIEGGNVPRIPSLPISYEDALPLLKLLEAKGRRASDLGDTWEGGLKHKIEYWTGPSEKTVRVVNEVDTKVMPIWNVMAVIPGSIPDEAVMIGNHIDAWVMGASDPSSGTAVVHEIYKGLGTLLKKGWTPLRTIYIGAWDAEEYGLIGSTEFVEDFGDVLAGKLVAYLNLDSSGAGEIFGASASPSLANLMKATSQEINDALDSTRSAWSAREDFKSFMPENSVDQIEAMLSSQTGIPSLGSGSDFTPFLQHLGIASSDGPGYHPGPNSPVYHYHSVYDSQSWMEKFGDPGFSRHITTAKILGLVLLRVADSLVLPLNITQYSYELSDYKKKVEYIYESLNFSQPLNLDNLSKGISLLQEATVALDVQKETALRKLAELTQPRKEGCLWKAKTAVKESAQKIQKRFAHWDEDDDDDDDDDEEEEEHNHHHHHHPHHLPSPRKLREIKKVLEDIKQINFKISHFEAGFIGEGLPGREWYAHTGTAPGRWLGYGATTLPSITEALTLDSSVEDAQIEADKVARLLAAMADRLGG